MLWFSDKILVDHSYVPLATITMSYSFDIKISYRMVKSNTEVLRKRAHGRCTLRWAQTGGWANQYCVLLSTQSGENSA